MLKDGNGVQMWVQPNTREVFKQIAGTTGESQQAVAARLAEAERKRLERKAARKP
jgi:RNA 3'-terminal phosphate cyclase